MTTVSPSAAAVPAAPIDPAVPTAAVAGLPGAVPQRFRARTFEELLPQIRAALGPDAIVLGRRESLAGGVFGFFQTRVVEVEAVAGAPAGFDGYDDGDDAEPDGPAEWPDDGDRGLDGAQDGAAAAGLAPHDAEAFLRHLDAAVERRRTADAVTPSAAPTVAGPPDPAPSSAPPSPPAPSAPRIAPWSPARLDAVGGGDASVVAEDVEAAADPAPAATAVSEPELPGTLRVPDPGGVDVEIAEFGLVARGLSPILARSVVEDATAHGRSLDPGHRIDRATRAALAWRIPRPGPRDDVRVLAVVGASGTGRTSAVAALAAARARAGQTVVALALGDGDAGAALDRALAGSGVGVLVARDGHAAAAALGAARFDLCVVDTPAVESADPDAVARLAGELRALGPDEVHLAVPGTRATREVHDVADGLAPLGADALLMTHRDEADRPGGLVTYAIVRGLPIVYVTDGRALALADPDGLARMVQP
jgi:flagellar biosynthesis GTPase FlhF